MALQLRAQTPDNGQGLAHQHVEVFYAPLYVFTSGAGRVVPFQEGQLLEVGRRYVLVAIPERDFVFINWNPVIVFNLTEYVYDASGGVEAITSTVVSRVPQFAPDPVLRFTMQSEEVIYDVPGVRKVTRSVGWQANFGAGRRRDHDMGRVQTRD